MVVPYPDHVCPTLSAALAAQDSATVRTLTASFRVAPLTRDVALGVTGALISAPQGVLALGAWVCGVTPPSLL